MNTSSCKATFFFHKKIQKFSCDLMLRPGWGKLVLNGFNFSPWHDRKKCCVSIWIQKAFKYIIYVTESLDQFILNNCSYRGCFHKLVCTLCQNSLCPMPNFWETFYWLKRSVQGTKDWRRAQFMKSKSFSHSVHLEWPWSGTRPNASKSKPLCQWIKHLCNAI